MITATNRRDAISFLLSGLFDSSFKNSQAFIGFSIFSTTLTTGSLPVTSSSIVTLNSSANLAKFSKSGVASPFSHFETA